MGFNTGGLEEIYGEGNVELKKVFEFSFFGKEYSKFKILTLDKNNYTNPRKIKIGSFSSLTYPSGDDGYSGRVYENTLKLSGLNRVSFVPKIKISSKIAYEEMAPMSVEYEKYFVKQNGFWVEDMNGVVKKIISAEKIFYKN
ncbi:MAG: hypothetical protein Q8Q04_01485 [archaeon]|nr:hypothetical protein [archaeon]